MENVQKSDFLLAKEIVAGLELNSEVFPEPKNNDNFRKYLKEHNRNLGKEFITKRIEGKLRVTRIK